MITITSDYIEQAKPLVDLVERNRVKFSAANPKIELDDGYASAGSVDKDYYFLHGLKANGSNLSVGEKEGKILIPAKKVTVGSLRAASKKIVRRYQSMIDIVMQLDHGVTLSENGGEGLGYQLINSMRGTTSVRCGRDISRSNNRLAQKIISDLYGKHPMEIDLNLRADKMLPYMILVAKFQDTNEVDVPALNNLIVDFHSRKYHVTERHLIKKMDY